MLRQAPLLAIVLFASTASAQEWPQFRGPDGLGVADSTPIPASFGPEENVLWSTKIPAGHSSPCIVGNRIYLTGFGDGNVVFAVDRTSGEMLWQKEFTGAGHPNYFHPDAGPALPTPVADEERVIAYLGDYGLVAFDHEGEQLWEKRMPHPGYTFGTGNSPLLYDGILVVPRDGAPEAALLVLDASDGSELWKINRFEYNESHGTPFLWRNADRDELVVAGTNKLCSYDLGSGELLWYVDGLTGFPCTTPTADEDTLYFAAWSTPNATGRSFWEAGLGRSLELTDAEVANPALLFKRLDANADGKIEDSEVPESRMKDAFPFLDRNQSGTWELEEMTGAGTTNSAPGENLMIAVARGAEGDASESHVRWSWKRGLPYVSSPLLYGDRIWLFKAGGIASAIEAKTGKPIFERERLPDRSEYYMSPVGAAGHVIVGSAEGTLYLIDAKADGLKIEHTAEFGEGLFATPAVLDGTIYLRSESTLWAFGTPGAE